MRHDEGQSGAAAELRHILGDVEEQVASRVLALDPTPQELETALRWSRGEGAVAGEQLTGKTAQIFDLLTLPNAHPG